MSLNQFFSAYDFMKPLLLLAFSVLLFTSCSDYFVPQILPEPFSADRTPAPPDYNDIRNWTALPEIADNADRVPDCAGCRDEQISAPVDVFFVHPTLYLDTNSVSNQWNASLEDEWINNKVDETTILYQASVFNGAGKIYAPRYREAHIAAYYSKKEEDSRKALDLAYTDVRDAFIYYMDHWNHGRPVIIASHSQGTTHAIRLLKEFFDGKELQKQLVAAYLIGFAVYDTSFSGIKICNDSSETGCYVTWRTFARNYFPEGYVKPERYAMCTNPLSWTADSNYVSEKFNKGGILKNFDRVIPGLSDAQVKDGVLRINKPHFFFSRFFKYNNYHIVDYNLFYMNIRENAQLRVKKFLDGNTQTNR
jgi:hypothetical protein